MAAFKILKGLSISDGLKSKLLQHFTTEAVRALYHPLARIPNLPTCHSHDSQGSMQELSSASISSLKAVRGVGPKKAQSIREALAQANGTPTGTIQEKLRTTSRQVRVSMRLRLVYNS